VLASRECRDLRVRWGAFLGHIPDKAPRQ
jgi:hypothetical protein